MECPREVIATRDEFIGGDRRDIQERKVGVQVGDGAFLHTSDLVGVAVAGLISMSDFTVYLNGIVSLEWCTDIEKACIQRCNKQGGQQL